MPYLYFDEAINLLTLNVRAPVLYSRGDSQTFDVPYWLITPATYAYLYAKTLETEAKWLAGQIPGTLMDAAAAAWAEIDAYARAHLDGAEIDAAFARQARLGRALPLPAKPDPTAASSPF